MVRLPMLPSSIRWALVVAFALVLATFSVVSPPTSVARFGPLGVLSLDKYLHFLGYAGFALVLGYAFADSPRPDWQLLGIVFLLAAGFGIGMEALQTTVPHRQFSLADMGANAVGTSIAVLCWRLALRRVRFYHVETGLSGR